MFVDALMQLSADQAFSATALMTNVKDLGNNTTIRQIGNGEPMGIQLAVKTAADFTTMDETYQLDILTDSDSALGSPTVVASYVIAAGQLAAGKKIFCALPKGGTVLERYLGGRMTLGGTTPSVTLSAHLCPERLAEGDYVFYPKGYTIS